MSNVKDGMINISYDSKPIIFFDGFCHFCNRSVQFVMKHDKQHIFLFAPLQGETALQMGLIENEMSFNSIVLWYNGEFYYRSTAVIEIARLLAGVFKIVATVSSVVPIPIRDWIYNIIAKNRYAWWGRRDTCFIPTESQKKQFLS